MVECYYNDSGGFDFEHSFKFRGTTCTVYFNVSNRFDLNLYEIEEAVVDAINDQGYEVLYDNATVCRIASRVDAEIGRCEAAIKEAGN